MVSVIRGTTPVYLLLVVTIGILLICPVSATVIPLYATAVNDGYVASWTTGSHTTIRSGTGGEANAAVYANYARLSATSTPDTYDEMYRAVILINKSVLVGKTINSVTLVTRGAIKYNGLGDFAYGITGFNPTNSDGTFVAGDYQRFYNERWSDTDITYADIQEGGNNNWTGNALFRSNLSAAGTWIGILVRDVPDIDNNSALVEWASGNYSRYVFEDVADGVAPYLEVDYSESGTPPVAGFSGTPRSGFTPLSVVFTDSSTGALSWNWSFGDGNFSISEDPTHEYAYNGTFSVNLTVTNGDGSESEVKTNYIVVSDVGEDPYAGFVADSIEGAEPLTIQFADYSYGTPINWTWNRTDVTGAGTPITFSIIRNATYTFYQGNWSIQLTVANAFGSNTTPANLTFVNVTGGGSPPVADFSVANQSQPYGEQSIFTDMSTGNPYEWLWEFQPTARPEFGWTSFGSTQNVSYDLPYVNNLGLSPGLCNIRLTATNAQGSDTEIKYAYIQVAAPPPGAPVANFTPMGEYHSGNWLINVTLGTQVNFTDTSSNSPDTWNWTFQNHATGVAYSNLQNPSYLYDAINATTGSTFSVTLNASNGAGFSTMTRYVSIYAPPQIPIARLYVHNPATSEWFIMEEGSPPTTTLIVDAADSFVEFMDYSYNDPTSATLSIDAGNGTIFNYYGNTVFSYTDAVPGYYPIWYNVSNDAGTDTLYFPTLIHIMDFTPPASVSGITNLTGATTIQWNWTNPASDVETIMVWKNGTWIENITYPQNGTTWTGLNPSTGYAIATKTVDESGNANATFTNSTAQTGVSQWIYYCTGAVQYWVAPLGVTEITLDIGAGGGSGACSKQFLGNMYLGYGGEKGETETISRVTVVPGVTYSVTTGCGGAATVYPGVSHAGTTSRFEGGILIPIIKTGGPGGLYPASNTPGNGTAGENGFLTGGNATWGYNGTYHSGGAPGSGWSSGAGGASGNVSEGGNGGKGSDGLIRITVYGTAGLNTPNFVADRTTGEPGTLVHFTDMSTIVDPDQLTYNWTFGDGEYSSSTNPQHVYSYTGTYDVSLTLANANGSITETKPEYINIATSTITVSYLPQQVRMRLIDTDSYPLSGVTVAATPLNFTAPENWTELLLGISPGVNVMGTTVSGVTGSDGSWVAPMVQSILYNISMVREPDINYAFQIYPSQSEYVFTIPLGVIPIPTSIANIVTYSLSNATINATHQFFNVTYSDTSTQGTDKLDFYVYDLGGTLLVSDSYTGSSANSQTFSRVLAVSQGQSYTYGFAANQSQYGWINQTDTVTFINQIALIGDAPSWVEEFVAIAIIILFSALFSIWSKAIAMIAMPLLTYFFQFVMGWLPSTFLSSTALGVMLTLGVLIYIRQKENLLT